MCVKAHIYALLVSKRRHLGLSQQELAARAGLRREKVNRIESRGEGVGFDELCRLAEALGLEFYVREKGAPRAAGSHASEYSSSGVAPASLVQHRLKPQEFKEAAFVDGSKAKILSWGKVPK